MDCCACVCFSALFLSLLACFLLIVGAVAAAAAFLFFPSICSDILFWLCCVLDAWLFAVSVVTQQQIKTAPWFRLSQLNFVCV